MRVWPSGEVALPEMSAGRRSFVKRKGPASRHVSAYDVRATPGGKLRRTDDVREPWEVEVVWT